MPNWPIEWERVSSGPGTCMTFRLAVPGGWLVALVADGHSTDAPTPPALVFLPNTMTLDRDPAEWALEKP